jgi:hypothetical protein
VDSESLEQSVTLSVSPSIVPAVDPSAAPSEVPSDSPSASPSPSSFSPSEYPTSKPTLRTRAIEKSEAEEAELAAYRKDDSWKAIAIAGFVVLPLATGAIFFLFVYVFRRRILPPEQQQKLEEV